LGGVLQSKHGLVQEERQRNGRPSTNYCFWQSKHSLVPDETEEIPRLFVGMFWGVHKLGLFYH